MKNPKVRVWLFILPLIFINVFVVLIPSLFSIYFSFTDWNGFGAAKFNGLANYRRLFSDPEFLNGLWHNILWTISSSSCRWSWVCSVLTH